MRSFQFPKLNLNREIPYRGIMADRGPPTADHYLTLAPSESFRTSVNINNVFNISEPGTYEINSGGLLARRAEGMKRRGDLEPGSVLLSSKLELLRTPVKLDSWESFKSWRRIFPFAHKGELPFANSLTIIITSNTTLSECFLTYNSED